MIIKINWKKLLISLLIPLATGGLSALITKDFQGLYETIKQPPLAPPALVFPIVWSVLYVLMGVSLYLVWTKEGGFKSKTAAYLIFAIQLFLNFIWSPVFFKFMQFLPAFVILCLLWLATLAMIISFYTISKPAGLLQIPYLIWLTFAAYLNFAVYYLN